MSDDLKNKRVITAALTGAWPTRKDNPNLPYTPEELAKAAYDCWKAGAAIVHIHVREDDGYPSLRPELYAKTVQLIKDYKDCDVLINITGAGGDLTTPPSDAYDDLRIQPIRENVPELCSYDCGSLNWQNRVLFENRPEFLEKLGKLAQEKNIKPEVEIFHPGMITQALYYMKVGVLPKEEHFQLVLGVAGGMAATVDNLVFMRNMLPPDATWAAAGIGAGHMPIMLATIAMGGHIRVGLEDNAFYQKGVLAESSAQFVERAVRLLNEAGLEPATPDEARIIYRLRSK